ncbi:sigma-70 family RNA polymerase sigma factor [Rhodovulum marinum]|uniref:RNA polymerase sigma-70 factor (ECF subfamily) n=1 Tax=Rhodovulum marinum TaxID=320662 RepID=A0A4R2PTA9_9RHOB|nr:sigma-70 family RNA polymerase sigma factor [Rhodovulum marinum]TCP39233.1 RNA polymerase sigma-70 factor (ECF subfamily) [Rhodovulum marinum]
MLPASPKSEVRTHIASLRRYALVLTRDHHEAEDLVQETLVKAIAKVDSLHPSSDLRPWLFRIMHNTHVSGLRRAQVRKAAEPDLPEPIAPERQHRHVELQQVLDALDRLPEAQRRPIVLVALEDMSYAEAARSLDVPLGTFMSRLGRGRQALRRILGEVKRSKISLIS